MIDILESSINLLTEEGFTVARRSLASRDTLVFENATVVGFLFSYPDSAKLVSNYEKDATDAITACQFGLRRAAQKAWNTYMIFLAEGTVSDAPLLASIEEDLSGSRKIARSGVSDTVHLREALLALLSLQAAPRLDAVDMKIEIRERVTELPPTVVDIFLARSNPVAVLNALEDER